MSHLFSFESLKHLLVYGATAIALSVACSRQKLKLAESVSMDPPAVVASSAMAGLKQDEPRGSFTVVP